jgi:hypothetical protein
MSMSLRHVSVGRGLQRTIPIKHVPVSFISLPKSILSNAVSNTGRFRVLSTSSQQSTDTLCIDGLKDSPVYLVSTQEVVSPPMSQRLWSSYNRNQDTGMPERCVLFFGRSMG